LKLGAAIAQSSASRRRQQPARPHPSVARVLVAALVLALTAVGCPCVDDTINSSPWLRWKIFAMFGAGRLCEEMTKRGAPLRLADGAPVVGRFFPAGCQSVLNDDRQTVTLQFSGDGYAWTPITKRISFTCTATVEYKPDFHKDGGTVYVWFRPASISRPVFEIGLVEQPAVGLATAMTPLGVFVNFFGQQIVSSELGRGFTVIHESAGDDFALGILEPGRRPSHPYAMHGSDRVMFMNEVAEVHGNTLDFLGPFEIDGSGRMLFAKFRSAGIALDVAVTTRTAGDAWRRQYQNQRGVPRPPAPPIAAGIIPADAETDRSIALPRGQYYLVVDNSAYVGQTAPPASLLFDPVARVSYLISMGDVP
jgi:hypothetical protein